MQAKVPPDAMAEAALKASTKASKPDERPEELIPELVQFLKAHPEIKAVPKAVQVKESFNTY